MKPIGMWLGTVITGVVFLIGSPAARGAEQAGGSAGKTEIKTLGVSDVKVSPTLQASTNQSGKGASLGRVAEAMDGQLIAAVSASRKFKVVARSDLDSLLKEQGFAGSGNVDLNDKAAAQSFKIRGLNYLVVTTIDDFQDFVEQAEFAAIGERATKRVIRLSCVAKIIDSTTGEVLEAPNFQISERDTSRKPGTSTTDGELSDLLMLQAARQMSELIANRVADVVFPAKIIALTGKQATINRGDGTSVAVGQIWDVFALGEEMLDPDTGEVLGQEETKVGAIRVTSVLPKFSKAEITETVLGQSIAIGQIIRPRLQQAEQPPQ